MLFRSWRSIGSAIVSASQPSTSTSVTGDLWLDTSSNRLYARTSAEWRLVGPVGNSADGEMGLKQETITDISSVIHKVVGLYVKGTRVAIISDDDQFTTTVTGFTTVYRGINFNSSLTNIKLNGTSVSTELFGGFTASQFMRSDASTGTTGVLSVTNNTGVLIGASSELSLSVDPTSHNIKLSNSYSGGNIELRTWDGSTYTNVINIDGVNKTAHADTAPEGTNTTQLATTAFVQTATSKWAGSEKYVSTSPPSSEVGNDGDIWLQRVS